MTPSQHRFEVLDSWRGLSASLVALFHLQAFSHFYDFSLLRHSYLFVDFFFVLSGFVITANYRSKLLSGFSFWQFMFLRLGRLYPLHFAILMAMVGLELVKYWFDGAMGGYTGNKFTGPNSVGALISNIFLVQGLHVHDRLTWNMPSWSISVEFYTYAVFALALLLFRRWICVFAITVVIVAPFMLFLLVGNIDTQYDWGIIRCVFGFFVGFISYDCFTVARQSEEWRTRMSSVGSLSEVLCVALIIAFVCLCNGGLPSLAAPAIFGLAVFVFSFEDGIVSRILKTRPFLTLGALSYSIYMLHMLVEVVIRYGLQFAEAKTGTVLFNDQRIGAELWQGDIAYVVTFALVVGASYVTYNLIEQPGRRLSRRLAGAIFPIGDQSKFLMRATGP